MSKNQNSDSNAIDDLSVQDFDESTDEENNIKQSKHNTIKKGHVPALLRGLFTRKRSRTQLLRKHYKVRLRDMIRMIMMAHIIMQRIQRELKLRNHHNKLSKNPLLSHIASILVLASKNETPHHQDANAITMQIAAISNLTDSKQSLCMKIIIDQIRLDPSLPQSIVMALEHIAKNEFIRQDGTSDNTMKNQNTLAASRSTEHNNIRSM